MKQRQQTGFTLMEIIIALSLTAMLLTMLTAGMFGVVRDWDDDASALEDSMDQAITVLQLERALSGAFPHSYRNQETLAREIYFKGEEDSLAWVSEVSPGRQGNRTAWQLVNDSEGVMAYLAPAMSDNPDERLAEVEPRLLFPGYQASFEYLYEDLEFARLWRDSWPGADVNILPLAVHVHLRPDDDMVSQPIDIIAAMPARQHRAIRPNLELIQ
ncbi:hypothetical protein GCM10011403_16000 [Pseudohongiella nitratireducens]|jgi:general secretion pathway protein J|uniref:General secretion pathway protein J n=1 Tax=Pseudohongiella nitratireducens TaxID=1768907 RepID=A0A917LV54_9GAMM|nr:prepilin-type N-terminal cleavage/methylation domain-containing protein [Pseudohongiella nitratireducens]GGG59430.1 hypothetical protein GCM10011403_16000 [Pseudohongiella nitratireducens]